MSDTNEKVDSLLTTAMKEAIKTFSVYDGSSRLITRYEVLSNAVDGQACLKTDYSYNGADTQPQKSKESVGVWSSAYDM